MHLRLFYYSLSKLCNRQWLPKSHSYCRCRTIWHKWPCERFLCRILVWPLCSMFIDILVTPMSAAGFRRLRHLAGRQTMVKPEESPPSTLAVRKCSSSPNLARVSSTLRSNWLPPCAEWQEQLEVLSQRDTDPTTCCKRASVIASQRDAPPLNIWLAVFLIEE